MFGSVLRSDCPSDIDIALVVDASNLGIARRVAAELRGQPEFPPFDVTVLLTNEFDEMDFAGRFHAISIDEAETTLA